jgi:hypothetical protein
MRAFRTMMALLLLSATAWAQCLDMTWEETFAYADPGEEHEFPLYLNNLQGVADSVTVSFVSDVPDGWTVFICVEGVCLVPWVTSTRIQVAAAYPDTVAMHIISNDEIAVGDVLFSAVPDGCPEETYEVNFTLSNDLAGVTPPVAEAFQLLHSYPNPFNPSTTIEFTLSHQQQIQLTVYDLQGRQIAQLADGLFASGHHQLTFDALDHPSGVYLVALDTPTGSYFSKISLIK